jgi:hypothetical protein
MDFETDNSEAAAEILKYIEKRFEAAGTRARMLLLDAWKRARFAPPSQKWKKRRSQNENPEEFLERVWGKFIVRYSLTTADIRQADMPLYIAWNNWKRSNTSTLVIPTKSEVNKKLAKKFEDTAEREFNAFRSRKHHDRRRQTRVVEAGTLRVG